MYNIIADIQYVVANNCFLHLSSIIHSKFNSVPKCIKGLVVKTQVVIYFSLNPGACRNLPDGSVGISALYASALGLVPGDKVVFSPLESTPSLSRITTRPLSQDDRDILEVESSSVEASLLNQLRIVWPNQCFPIWVSPTVTVKLVVDCVYPNVEVGRLDEHTELIIGDVKQPEKLITKPSNELSSCLASDESEDVEDDYSLKPSEFIFESIICRLVPYNDDNPPYLVTLSSSSPLNWLKPEEPGSVYQLSNYLESLPKVYVSVILSPPSALDIGSYHTLNASWTVLNHLSSSYGSKVLLTCLDSSHSNELSSLLITPCPLLKNKYSFNEIKEIFRKKLSKICIKYGRCLLNTKGKFPLDNETFVTVTLRPLNLEWCYITLISSQSLSISVNTYEVDNSVTSETLINDCQNKQISCPVGSVYSEINLLFEHSLGLKCGIKNTPSFTNNFLLVGKHGIGKSHISNYILRALSQFPYYVHFEKIDCTTLKGKRIENMSKLLNSHLTNCKLKQPSVLLIEHIEIICGTFSPELEKSEASFHIQRVSQKVADLLESIFLDSSLLVFGTCTSISTVNNALFKRRGKSFFSTVLPIQPLSQDERKELIELTILERTSNSEQSLKDLNLDYFAALTDAYVPGDLIKFIEKSIFEAVQRHCSDFSTASHNELKIKIIRHDLDKAFDSSSAFMRNKLKVQKSQDVKLSDIGGLKEVKDKLIEVILWPSKYSSLINQCPLRKQNGVLIYGPPGSGKTLMARAIATESKLNFITVKGPELMSKYIGESEEGVRRVFENAQAAKPSLLFFDEFESLAPRRGEEQTGVTDRVVNQLLTALDGVEPISGVVVVAASSRPDLIDPALLRPGRLSQHLFCSFPNREERVEVLEKLTKQVSLSEDVNFNDIADRTENFSGADLKGLLTTAQIQVLDRLADGVEINEYKGVAEKAQITLTQDDILFALSQTQPSLSKKDRLHYASIYQMFSKGKIPDVTKQKSMFA